MKNNRIICFVLTSKIHYARNRLILEELKKNKNVDLKIILSGSALIDKYGSIEDVIIRDGFNIDEKIEIAVDGGTTSAMAKTAGLALVTLPSVFVKMKPDIIVIRGDRYEMLPIATAAAFMNIPIAHIEGGDVTGTIDESVRHAITKLAHFHFATNKDSYNRIIQMGENPKYVFNIGSPDIDIISKENYKISNDDINAIGVGDVINTDSEFIMVMQHSVTTEIENIESNIDATLKAIHCIGKPTIWFWPNIDAGSNLISKHIRRYREMIDPPLIRFIKYIEPEKFISLLKKTSCLVGNSSAGLKECSYLGVPVVNIGSRQNGRYSGNNVIHTPHKEASILRAIKKQLNAKSYKPDKYYFKPEASRKIAELLVEVSLYTQKSFRTLKK